MSSILLVWLAVGACATATAQRGGPTASVSDGETVEGRLLELQRELADLQRQIGGSAQFAGAVTGCPECGGKAGPCCTDGKGSGWLPDVRLTGFFHLDMGVFNQDSVNRTTLGDIEDGLGFRRARIAAAGKVSDRTSFIIEFDFAQSQPRFVDVWMQFADTPIGQVRIGRYRQPFGMAELTSIRELPFLERPTAFALSPFRQTGMMAFDSALDERLTWAISGYRYLSDNFGNVYADTGGYGMATRLTYLPIDDGGHRLVHLGVDYSYNDPGRGQVQYVSTNEIVVTQNPNLGPSGLSVLPLVGVPPFVNTGAMSVERTNLFNVEGALQLGRLIIQSEARWARVSLANGTTQTFPAAYAHVRYVLTGEAVPYNRATGVFQRVDPLAPVDVTCGQWGAWEVMGRVSYIDLNGTGLPGPGRRLTNTVVGLNWYINHYTRFSLNYIHSDLADPSNGDSNADVLAVRGQIDF